VKLSAPPPPPPEPSQPGSTPEPNPGGDSSASGGAGEAATSTSLPPGPATHAPAVSASGQAKWPAWFAGVDVLLAVLALALGFLLASFTARNSDVWLHLGTGRMLTTGEYHLGSDPLSYSAAQRPWINHHWLYDLGTYLIYQIDSSALVFVKALAITAAMGLLIAIRRPGQSLLPWAGFVVIAVVAAAPRFTLQPLIGSIFFLALTLFLVFRLNRPGSWRLPVAIGITFWFWANVDTWFILGPAALGLLLIGELIRTRVLTTSTNQMAANFLDPLPDVSTLARALLIGIVACMLNPHHYHVWQIPFELTPPNVVATEPLFRIYHYSPLNRIFWTNEGLGYNRNGPAYAALLGGGFGVVLVCIFGMFGLLRGPMTGLGLKQLPLSHAILWCGFALLSLLSLYTTPFLAVVTVPILASFMNARSRRITLGTWGDRRTRLLLTGAAAWRMALVVAFLAFCASAWTGWLQPKNTYPAFTRRVSWELEPDPALVEATGQIQQWREQGDLPADARGMITSVDLANYCAWYAPAEKVFLNGRYNHHRLEIPDFVTVRAALELFPAGDDAGPSGQEPARRVMKERESSYLVIASPVGDRQDLRERAALMIGELASAWQRCAAWYLNGRAAIFGWRASPGTGKSTFERLALDPVRLAFGPKVERLPAGKAAPIPPPSDWTDDFVRPPPRPAGPGVEEAIAWLRYKQTYANRQGIKTIYTRILMHRLAPRMFGPPGAAEFVTATVESKPPHSSSDLYAPWPPAGATLAAPILALRAARRAIAANPDHPDGYYALAQVLNDPDLPIPDAERSVAVLTALRQCLYRMPPPAEWRRGVYQTVAFDVARQLSQAYLVRPLSSGNPNGQFVQFQGTRIDAGLLGPLASGDVLVQVPVGSGRFAVVRASPQDPRLRSLPAGSEQLPGSYLQPLDLAQRAMSLARQYAAVEIPADDSDRKQSYLKGLDEQLKQLDEILRRETTQYRQTIEQTAKLKDRYGAARQRGLIGEAIDLLRKADLQKEFGPDDAPRIALQRIALELAVGQLEDAAGDIAALREEFDKAAGKTDPRRLDEIMIPLRYLEYLKLSMEGDYATAGAEFEQLDGRIDGRPIGEPMKIPPEIENAPAFKSAILKHGAVWPLVPTLGAANNPIGSLSWFALGQIQFQGYMNFRTAIYSHLEREATFFFRRGFLALVEGDIDAAKLRFEHARRTAPPGWGPSEVAVPQAESYLRLIEAARKSP
jgi:hypothetical protein